MCICTYSSGIHMTCVYMLVFFHGVNHHIMAAYFNTEFWFGKENIGSFSSM